MGPSNSEPPPRETHPSQWVLIRSHLYFVLHSTWLRAQPAAGSAAWCFRIWAPWSACGATIAWGGQASKHTIIHHTSTNISGVDTDRPDNPPPGTTWTFTADGKSVLALGKDYPKLESKYTTDPKKAPVWLDMAEGPKGTPLIGIYKVDGDTLTLCLGGKVGDRPMAFEAPAGSTTSLMILMRVKEKE
jgi:uncharacterized protein (TIGR03067 family)